MQASPDRVINGDTLFFATPGDPVSQIRLPLVMEPVFKALDVNAVWLPMHVDRSGLRLVLQGLREIRNFKGITVAIPHKPVIPTMLDRLSLRAQAAGTVNLVRLEPDGSLFGDIADGAGFVRGLEIRGYSPAGAKVWLVGAGGAGAAIGAALAESGVERLYVTEAIHERGVAVVERLKTHYKKTVIELVSSAPEAIDFAVNATPCGLRPGDPLPFDPGALSAKTIVCDIIMKPKETALLRTARERGMRIHHGHHTLDTQIPMYLRFFGIAVPDEQAIIALASGISA